MAPTTAPSRSSGTCSALHSGALGEPAPGSAPTAGALLRADPGLAPAIGQWAQSAKGSDCPSAPNWRPAIATQCRPCACSSSTLAPLPPVASRAACAARWNRSASLKVCSLELLLYLNQHRMHAGFVRSVSRQRLERRAGLRQRRWDSQRIDGMGGGCRHERRKT